MNDTPANTNPASEPTAEEKEAMLKAWREEVALAMRHVRRLFDAKMVLTFIARDPNDPNCITRLSEETDWDSFLEAAKQMGAPAVVAPNEMNDNTPTKKETIQ